MNPGPIEGIPTSSNSAGYVSARFLSDFFSALSKCEIDARNLVGDLPISVDSQGCVTGAVEWSHFVDFIHRLEREVKGAEGLENLGEMICDLAPARTLQSLAGLAASPLSLYRAASGWALRRVLPGIESSIEQAGENDIAIHACVTDSLRACPQLFQIATGGARALPRILGMPSAVVSPEIGERKALFRITLPPSRTISARIRRFLQVLFSTGSVLRFLEDQQLDFHAKHDELMRAHARLAKKEQRHREIADAAVDVLCEVDADGQVSYVSAAISELLGYSPEQVTGSHFRLWIPAEYHAIVTKRFEQLFTEPARQTPIREPLILHAAGGRRVPVELVARTYRLSDPDRSFEADPNMASHHDVEASAITARAPIQDDTRGHKSVWRFVATIRALNQKPSSPPSKEVDAGDLVEAEPVHTSVLPEHLFKAVEYALLESADGRDTSD